MDLHRPKQTIRTKEHTTHRSKRQPLRCKRKHAHTKTDKPTDGNVKTMPCRSRKRLHTQHNRHLKPTHINTNHRSKRKARNQQNKTRTILPIRIQIRQRHMQMVPAGKI